MVRATSPFNYWQPGPPVLQLLCGLQTDGQSIHMFDWGPLAAAPYLPRVRSGRVVLARARWRLSPGWETGDLAAQVRSLRAWRARMAVPRWVSLMAGEDLRLPLDLESTLCIELLASRSRAGEHLFLEQADTPLCLRGPDGDFAHELIVPLIRAGAPAAAAVGPVSPGATPDRVPVTDRIFPPGTSWLAAHLSLNERAGDAVLRDLVAPFAQALADEGIADSFHFVRGDGADFQLCLRFHGEPDNLLARGLARLSAVAAAAIGDGRVARLQLDTYEREIERCGGLAAVKLSETLWHADSRAVLVGLERVRDPEQRWLLTAVGVDLLMGDAGLDETARLALVRRLRDDPARHGDAAALRSPEARERARRRLPEVGRALGAARTAGSDSTALTALHIRSAAAVAVYEQLAELRDGGRLQVTWTELVAAHVQQHVSRMLTRPQSRRELAVYDVLARHYEGSLARRRAHPPVADRGRREPARIDDRG